MTKSSVFQDIPINRIRPSAHQGRKQFDPTRLRELAESMRAEGLLEPIIVRVSGGGDTKTRGRGATTSSPRPRVPASPRPMYELISGERRLRAAKILGWKTIEAKIIEVADEATAAVKGLIENLQREDLNPIEEAEGFAKLHQLDRKKWNQGAIAKAIGKTQGYVSQSIMLLTLPGDLQENIRRLIISRSHGLELARLPTPELQYQIASQIKDVLTAKETRRLVDQVLNQPNRPPATGHRPPSDLEPFPELWKRWLADPAVARLGSWGIRYLGKWRWSLEIRLGIGDVIGEGDGITAQQFQKYLAQWLARFAAGLGVGKAPAQEPTLTDFLQAKGKKRQALGRILKAKNARLAEVLRQKLPRLTPQEASREKARQDAVEAEAKSALDQDLEIYRAADAAHAKEEVETQKTMKALQRESDRRLKKLLQEMPPAERAKTLKQLKPPQP